MISATPSCFDTNFFILLIREKNTNLYQLSMDTGIDKTILYRIRSGRSPSPSFKSVAKLAEYFDVPIEAFKTGNVL